MLAADTNVLLRMLLDEDEEQSRAARVAQRTHGPLFVGHVVLAEAARVLTSAYGFSRDKLGGLVEMLLDTDGIVLQEPGAVQAALGSFRASRADFADCLILAVSQAAGAMPLATFDDRLGKLPGTRRLGVKRKAR